MSIQVSGGSEILVEAPPCLECHVRNGVGQGGRNCVALAYTYIFQEAEPKAVEAGHKSANHSYFKPPLPASELVTIQDQIEKKDYFYQCTEPQLCIHCNKNFYCRQRQIRHRQQCSKRRDYWSDSREVEPRIWFVDVAGARLELTTEQLQMPTQFQRACMEQLNFAPPNSKRIHGRQL